MIKRYISQFQRVINQNILRFIKIQLFLLIYNYTTIYTFVNGSTITGSTFSTNTSLSAFPFKTSVLLH